MMPAQLIFQLELFAITVALTLWGECMQGEVVLLRSDNQAVVCAINHRKSTGCSAGITVGNHLAVYAISDSCDGAAHPRGQQPRKRPLEPGCIPKIQAAVHPQSSTRVHPNTNVALMLEALGIHSPRWLRGLNSTGRAVIGHFRKAVADKKLPLQLGQPQIQAFLEYIRDNVYKISSLCSYWNVLCQMLDLKAGQDTSFDPEITEENELLLDTVQVLALKVKDTKLPVTLTLL